MQLLDHHNIIVIAILAGASLASSPSDQSASHRERRIAALSKTLTGNIVCLRREPEHCTVLLTNHTLSLFLIRDTARRMEREIVIESRERDCS